MIDPKKVAFPITAEAFAALQEAEIGRKLYPEEKELFTEFATLTNDVYESATRGDVTSVQKALDFVNGLPADNDTDRHLRGLCLGWVRLAVSKGAHNLKITIDRQAKQTKRKGPAHIQ